MTPRRHQLGWPIGALLANEHRGPTVAAIAPLYICGCAVHHILRIGPTPGEHVELLREQLLQYETQGFVHLHDVIPKELVARVKTAFDRATEEHRNEWKRLSEAKQPTAPYYDIPDILDIDDAFVELADLSSIMPLLLQAVGTDIQLNHTHARVMFPGKTFTAAWHSDLATLLGVDLANSPRFFAKVHFYFEDLQPEQGCLGFIPGSHRLPVDDNPKPAVDGVSNAAVAVRVIPKAGDAVLFNVHCRHMAFDNHTALPRKSLIYAYSHFWLKNYANAVPRDLARVATTPLRKQLFGVETAGISFFDQRLDVAPAQEDWGSLRAASKRLLNRVLKGSSITKVK
jgi:phytanoyl-CoA hydroxylase